MEDKTDETQIVMLSSQAARPCPAGVGTLEHTTPRTRRNSARATQLWVVGLPLWDSSRGQGQYQVAWRARSTHPHQPPDPGRVGFLPEGAGCWCRQRCMKLETGCTGESRRRRRQRRRDGTGRFLEQANSAGETGVRASPAHHRPLAHGAASDAWRTKVWW